MSAKIGYYLGLLIGGLFFYSLIGYCLYNGYKDFINHRDIIDNITLLFVIFTWRKVYHTFGLLSSFLQPLVNKD